MKQPYKIIIAVLILLAGAVSFYFFWKKITLPKTEDVSQTTLPTETTNIEINTNTTQETQNNQTTNLTKMSDSEVFDFWVNRETKEVYYFTSNGNVFSAKDGDDLLISSQTIDALNFIQISPESKRVLASFGDPQNPKWGVFDSIDGVWKPLPENIKNAGWGNVDNLIYAVVKNNLDNNLSSIDISKNTPVTSLILKSFQFKDVFLSSKPTGELIIIERPSATYASRIWQLNTKKLAFNLLSQAERGLLVKMSPKEKSGFKFSYPDKFFIIGENYEIKTPLIFTSFPQKCDISSKIVYCFVPNNMPDEPTSISLPDDYLQHKFYSIDDLHYYNTETDETEIVMKSNSGGISPIDAKNTQYVDDALYFINSYDNYIYKINLSEGGDTKNNNTEEVAPQIETND